MKKAFFIIMALTVLQACQTKAPSKIQDDQKLFTQGMHYFDRTRYISAMDYFLELKNRFPESPYHEEAKLRLADSYFYSKEYIDAEIQYHQFVNLHPLYEDIERVWLKLGKSQYLQAPKSHQKDLKQIRVAKSTFMMIQRKWPGTEEAEEAQEMIQKCVNKEIKKQLYLANFYYRTHKYDIAIKKLEELSLENTPKKEFVGERNLMLAKAYIKTDETEPAKMILQAILDNPHLDDFHGESRRYLRKLD